MTWTYSLALTTDKDRTRLLIGDTNTAAQQLQDEEITFLLTQSNSIYGAAAACCYAIAAAYAQKADETEGDIRINYSQIAKAFTARAAAFQNTAVARGGGLPYSGGTSVADKIAQEQNTDRVGPEFSIAMMDNLTPIPSSSVETLETADPNSVETE